MRQGCIRLLRRDPAADGAFEHAVSVVSDPSVRESVCMFVCLSVSMCLASWRVCAVSYSVLFILRLYMMHCVRCVAFVCV